MCFLGSRNTSVRRPSVCARGLPSLPRALGHGTTIPCLAPLARASAALRSSRVCFRRTRRREAWAEKKMEAWPVSLRVNGLKHPGAELVRPLCIVAIIQLDNPARAGVVWPGYGLDLAQAGSGIRLCTPSSRKKSPTHAVHPQWFGQSADGLTGYRRPHKCCARRPTPLADRARQGNQIHAQDSRARSPNRLFAPRLGPGSLSVLS